jgi:hypothetical protein
LREFGLELDIFHVIVEKVEIGVVLRVIPVDLVHFTVLLADPVGIELSLLVGNLIALIVEHLVLVIIVVLLCGCKELSQVILKRSIQSVVG